MNTKRFIPLFVLILAVAGLLAVRAEAQPRPSSKLLLPYFEVDLGESGKTTLFAVGNALDKPVEIQVEVRTNWGIVVASFQARLEAHEVKSFNLLDWVLQGKLPNRTLRLFEKNQLKAALVGQKAPQDSLYYGTPVADDLAVGSVVIRALPGQPANALWGDFLLIDPETKISMGDDLVNIDQTVSCPGAWLCARHALRFLSSAPLNAETQVVIWTDRSVAPSKTAYPENRKVLLDGLAYNEAGEEIDDVHLRLLPLQVVSIGSLGLGEPFGWLDLTAEEPTFIGLHFDSIKRDGAALQAYCLPETPQLPPPGPGLEIEKRTNGERAVKAPGPTIAVGAPVLWEYVVRNTGEVRLTNVVVTDDDASVQISCPKNALEPGELMLCIARGTAQACQYRNVGTVTATDPDGNPQTRADESHYFGGQNAKIDLETAVNGQDADTAPGPVIPTGTPVQWTYVVTNNGDVALSDIKVTDDQGITVSCPKASLRPGESMTCNAGATSTAGQHRNLGTVAAKPPCGNDVKDDDPAYYQGTGEPGLKLHKLTNGQHHSQAPGANVGVGSTVTWSYIVTNTGKVVLNNIKVTDDKVGNISCPKSTLQPDESMTCTASGIAAACQYMNTGTAVGTPPNGPSLTAQDWGFYFGQTHPGISLKKHTNGQDADTAPGPDIPVGNPVVWTYVVTNTGDVALSDVKVTDDRGVSVSCPKTSLQKGEAMTCTGNGTAIPGQYRNVGTVIANPPCGSGVQASDPSHYFGKGDPGIKLEKRTNGQHYSQAPGANLAVGSPVTWSYLVTNTGQVALSNVKVTDDKVGNVSCPKTSLQPGESMTCTASGTAAACQYSNTGTVVGTPPTGQNVTDQDWSFYFGQTHPAIDIQKLTNGQDGPTLTAGDAVKWTYLVTNAGDASLTDVRVTDDKGVVVSCPKTTLQKGESMTCTGNGTAIVGEYRNVGTVTANPPCGSAINDSDASWYTGKSKPASVQIKKYTNGEDADWMPGPKIPAGGAVKWTYIVTNTGEVALSNVKVTDDRGVAVSCPKTSLQPAESMTCTGNGTATLGQYKNIGTVVGTPPSGSNVTDDDPSHYYGEKPPSLQGCTPGYWKNHTESWQGYTPGTKTKYVFDEVWGYSGIKYDTLLEALGYNGGSGDEGAAKTLLRAAVASLLNAAHSGVNFPRSVSSIISDVNAALDSESRTWMLTLATALDNDNNLGCPLN